MKKTYEILLSLRTSLWLLFLITLFFIAGAVIMPSYPELSSIDIPLFKWLVQQPSGAVWWLWGAVGLLAILSVNTLFCSIESIIKKRKVTQWLLLVSPQIIHTGFIFILLAHLLGAVGSYHYNAAVAEGYQVKISEGELLRIKNIDIQLDPQGYVNDWSLDLEYLSGGRVIDEDRIAPNKPSLHNSLNIIAKDVQPYPKAALLQISKDPGAVWALAGGLLFITGILILIALRIKMEK
ncbi:MAG: hypothetical protein HY807_02985 [Nitrospirae bacterium]|nr:hypothetical protein [Nitrospirota bacterium]